MARHGKAWKRRRARDAWQREKNIERRRAMVEKQAAALTNRLVRESYIRDQQTKPAPDRRKLPEIHKALRVTGPNFTSDSVWKRHRGHWSCFISQPPFEWFTRVKHARVVEDHLRLKHFSWQWIHVANPLAQQSVGQQGLAPAEDYTLQSQRLTGG